MLAIADLHLTVNESGSSRPILRGVDLKIAPGQAVGLVGESGSGKSMTAKAVVRMTPPGSHFSGTINYNGADVAAMDQRELAHLRTHQVGMIFQDPRAAINPLRTIGDTLTEVLTTKLGSSRREANMRAVNGLHDVGVENSESWLSRYPHSLSGGQLQRVMIAAALITDPTLLIADEPTTALDSGSQAEVVATLDRLRKERHLGLLFITHDLDLAEAFCDEVYVMYAGQIVEHGPSARIYGQAAHPYTRGLLGSRPSLDHLVERLSAIPGRPISGAEADRGCAFRPRCTFAQDRCSQPQELHRLTQGAVRCIRHAELVQG